MILSKKMLIMNILITLAIVAGIVLYLRRAPNPRALSTTHTTTTPRFKNIKFTVPEAFSSQVENINPGQTVLTIENGTTKLAIFDPKDFGAGGPVWIFPYSGTDKQGLLPRTPTEERTITIGKAVLGAWLFYDKGDNTENRDVLNLIIASGK